MLIIWREVLLVIIGLCIIVVLKVIVVVLAFLEGELVDLDVLVGSIGGYSGGRVVVEGRSGWSIVGLAGVVHI